MSIIRSMAGKHRFVPVIFAVAGVALGAPHVGFALPGAAQMSQNAVASNPESFRPFTPATVDPQLAMRVAQSLGMQGMRFTPAATGNVQKDRTVTVAVRVDERTARAISVRSAIDSASNAPGLASAGTRPVAIASTKYNLGIARGYQGFAKKVSVPSSANRTDVADLGQFDLAKNGADKKPSRFQPRIALEQEKAIPGRSEGTLQGLGDQSVDLGGAYRVTRNLNVTAGVRLSQERDRLAPLTDSEADSQAVYVGTQFRF